MDTCSSSPPSVAIACPASALGRKVVGDQLAKLAAYMDGRIKACDEQIDVSRSAMADSGSPAAVVKLLTKQVEVESATILEEALSRIEGQIQLILGEFV